MSPSAWIDLVYAALVAGAIALLLRDLEEE